jgi:hypothetical protein
VFERFLRAFRLTPEDAQPGEPWNEPLLESVRGYTELASRFAGCTFDDGLYRIHDARSGPVAGDEVATAFPDFADRAVPFAFDWLGRQFALDRGRVEGEPQVLLLEPGTGEALEIPCGFVDFHDGELVEFRDAALAESFFRDWRAAGGAREPLAITTCVGYRVPLFLGGKDRVENLEVIEWAVYWEVLGQLRLGTAKLPPGTSVREVTIRDP